MAPVTYREGRFPPDSIDWALLIPLLGPAAAAVARYDGMLAAIPNPAVLLSWTGWSGYFLEAVQSQAEDNLAKAGGILALYGDMKLRIPGLTRSQYAIHALDWIFGHPIFKIPDFVAGSGIPVPTAKRLLAVLREKGVLRTLSEGRGRRAAVLAFPALLNLAEGRDVF